MSMATRRKASGKRAVPRKRAAPLRRRLPEYEAKRYEGRIKSGGILISVHCDDSEWADRAKKILEATGAQDISSTGEATADFDKSDRPHSRASSV